MSLRKFRQPSLSDKHNTQEEIAKVAEEKQEKLEAADEKVAKIIKKSAKKK